MIKSSSKMRNNTMKILKKLQQRPRFQPCVSRTLCFVGNMTTSRATASVPSRFARGWTWSTSTSTILSSKTGTPQRFGNTASENSPTTSKSTTFVPPRHQKNSKYSHCNIFRWNKNKTLPKNYEHPLLFLREISFKLCAT